MVELLYESNILNQNIDYYILENKYNELININEVKLDTRWQKIKNGISKVLNKIIDGFKFLLNKVLGILKLLPKAIKFMMNILNHISKAKYRDDKKEIVCCDIGNLTKSLDKCYTIYTSDIIDAGSSFFDFSDGLEMNEENYQQIEKAISELKERKNNVFPEVKKEIEENKKVVKKYTYEKLTKEFISFTKELNGDSYKNYRHDTARLKRQIECCEYCLKDAKKSAPLKPENEDSLDYRLHKKFIEFFTIELSYKKMYLSLATSTEVFIMKEFKKFISRNDMENL